MFIGHLSQITSSRATTEAWALFDPKNWNDANDD